MKAQLVELLRKDEEFMLFPLLTVREHGLKQLAQNPGSALADMGNPHFAELVGSADRISADILYDVNGSPWLAVARPDIDRALANLKYAGFAIEYDCGQPVRGLIELNTKLGYAFN